MSVALREMEFEGLDDLGREKRPRNLDTADGAGERIGGASGTGEGAAGAGDVTNVGRLDMLLSMLALAWPTVGESGWGGDGVDSGTSTPRRPKKLSRPVLFSGITMTS